jgi:hypothetical protein
MTTALLLMIEVRRNEVRREGYGRRKMSGWRVIGWNDEWMDE